MMIYIPTWWCFEKKAKEASLSLSLNLLLSFHCHTIISSTVASLPLSSSSASRNHLSQWQMLMSLTMSSNKADVINFGFLLSIPTSTFTILILLPLPVAAPAYILSETPTISPPVDFTPITIATYPTLATVISWDFLVVLLPLHPTLLPSPEIIPFTTDSPPETFLSSNPSPYLCPCHLTPD